MNGSQLYCEPDERRRGVVSAIVNDGGGHTRPYSDVTRVIEFFPHRTSLPDDVLERIREGIRCRCWCETFGVVKAQHTVGQLQSQVYRRQRRQGGPRRQDCSPPACCT